MEYDTLVFFTSCVCSTVADYRRQPRATLTATATMSSIRPSARRTAEPSSLPVMPAAALTSFSPTAPRSMNTPPQNVYRARFIL